MKKHIFVKSWAYALFLVCAGNAFSGSLSTSGQGSRALSMGGAFTAVADDGSAIYYNPAGISRIKQAEIMLGIAHGQPVTDYLTPSGAKEQSSKDWLGYWFFATHHLSHQWTAGLGIYSPYARDAEFKADLANGFAAQNSSIYRLDISPVLSFKPTPHYSLSAGFIIAYSKAEQSLPTGPTTRISDSMDGWGIGGIISALVSATNAIDIGLTYRSRMTTDFSGTRQLQTLATTTNSHAEANAKWPASAGLGVAWQAAKDLKLSFDTHWTGWSYADKIVTKTTSLGDSTTLLDQRDTWDYRIGGEWRYRNNVFVRAGYSRIHYSMPASRILPSQADSSGSAYDFGIGKAWQHWAIDAAYEYAATDTVRATDNAYGFTGKYEIYQHTIALTSRYRFSGLNNIR